MLDKTVALADIQPIVIDAGVVYKNWGLGTQKMIGVTRGGNVFNVEPEYKEVERDGARGKEKGLKRLINLDVTLATNIMSLTKENVKDAIGCAKIVGNVVKSKLHIADSDYLDNITLIGETLSGEYKRITVKNAFADEGIEIAMEDKEETSVEVTFSGHFNPQAANMTEYEEIFEIEDLVALPEIDQYLVTFTAEVTGTGTEGVTVAVYDDTATLVTTLNTDSDGVATLALTDGDYSYYANKVALTPTTAEFTVASAALAVTITLTA